MLRAFLKDSLVYTIPSLLSRGLSLFLVPLYTRVLSPADYGSLDLLTVFAGIVNLTIALEISQGVARFYPIESDPQRKTGYASVAFWFTLSCYSVFCILCLSCTRLLAPLILGQPGHDRAFQLGIGYITLNGLFYLLQNQLRWELRSQAYAVTSMLMSIVSACLAAYFSYGLHWGLEGLLLGMLIGSGTAIAASMYLLRQSIRFTFDRAILLQMLGFSSPLVLSGIAVWVSLYIDRVMINHFLSIREVGLYGIGYRVASIASLAMVGFQGALTPLVYTHYREADTPFQLARIFRFFMATALIMFSGLTLFSEEILHMLTSASFYSGASVVIYLVPALLLSNMYIFTPGISIAKKTHFFIWINLGSALLNLTFNYLLIPVFGFVGAAIATLMAYVATFATYMTLSQKFYKVPHRWLTIGASTILTVLFTLGAENVMRPPILAWITKLATLVVLMIIFIVLGLIRRSEISKGIDVAKRILNISKA